MREGLLLLAALAVGACTSKEAPAPPAQQPPPAAAGDLSPFQLEHGIGPITAPIALGPLDEEMAEEGEEIFEVKCTASHKRNEKYVGPALAGVTERRTAAYIMNMILNPQEMVERHPVAKQLLAEHMTFMPAQGLTEKEAREVVEYLRTWTKSE